MTPYRRHLIGLPLQRSAFSTIDRAPALIGMTGVLPGDRLGVWLDDDGDLYLDRASIDRLAAALSVSLSPAFLEAMDRSLVASCVALEEATERCRRRAPEADAGEARRLLEELGTCIRALVPFGILSKFVPDVLCNALTAATGADIPTLRSESPGAVLTRESLALFMACDERGFPPERLLREWPRVPSVIADQVRGFCGTQVGFGPLRWEAPGYEDPLYVFGVLQAAFAGQDPAELSRRLGAGARARDASAARGLPAAGGELARVVILWLEFLERETWYVRRAFYVGMRPLLRRLLTEYRTHTCNVTAEDILFLELDELVAPRPDLARARARRAKYAGNSAYLAEHGLVADRLDEILGAA